MLLNGVSDVYADICYVVGHLHHCVHVCMSTGFLLWQFVPYGNIFVFYGLDWKDSIVSI